MGKGGSTAVTAILINCHKLVVANIGDSRAVICKKGVAKQLSVDHEPTVEKQEIESRGGFVSNFPGKRFTERQTNVVMFLYFHTDNIQRLYYMEVANHMVFEMISLHFCKFLMNIFCPLWFSMVAWYSS